MPGKSMKYTFDAKHPGVYMYHCATQPVLMHTGAGMVGMMIVKPKNLPAVDRELWMTQQEFYVGKPGQDADMAKMQAKKPDVITFNGFANQYKDHPIAVRKDEKVRMYVLNAGPSIWSAFHVIGTVFDKTVVEGQVGHDAQTINLAPSQDRKSTRLNSSHANISYAVFCLKKKKYLTLYPSRARIPRS